MRITFACGHKMVIANTTSQPTCACGETRVQSISAPPPTFRGACSGPFAEFQQVEPAVVVLASGKPLTIKDQV